MTVLPSAAQKGWTFPLRVRAASSADGMVFNGRGLHHYHSLNTAQICRYPDRVNENFKMLSSICSLFHVFHSAFIVAAEQNDMSQNSGPIMHTPVAEVHLWRNIYHFRFDEEAKRLVQ